MKNYKNKLFESYLDSHIRSREGLPESSDYLLNTKYFGKIIDRININKDSKILDIGCGVGFFLYAFKRNDFTNLRGVEFSKELVEIANGFDLNCVVQGDIFEELSKKEKFDLIILKDVIEHFEREEIFTILELANEKLNDTGKILVQVPNANNLFSGRILYNDFTHELSFTKDSLRQILFANGFINLNFYKNEPYLYDILSLKRILKYIIKSTYHKIVQILLYVEDMSRPVIVSESIIVIAEKK